MNPQLGAVGSQIAVSHGRHPHKAEDRNCYGGVATITGVYPQTFAAECACGWRFSGMRTDGYRKP
jgi:hypothetical protein